jgi:hypothetical protein
MGRQETEDRRQEKSKKAGIMLLLPIVAHGFGINSVYFRKMSPYL